MSLLGRLFFATIAIALMVGAAIYLGRRPPDTAPIAQAPVAAPPPVRRLAEEIPGYASDADQRSLRIYEFKKAADSGAERGREIFYYKCWFCHNEYAGEQSRP